MIFAEIHAIAVQMQNVVLRIISQFAHVNKVMMEIQKSNVFALVVDQMMNVRVHMPVLIVNAHRYALSMGAHVVNALSVMALIIVPFVNVRQD